jgi:hypothetical protein
MTVSSQEPARPIFRLSTQLFERRGNQQALEEVERIAI